MKIKNIIQGFLLFFVAGYFGANQMLQSWEGMVYFYPHAPLNKDNRLPAAIQRSYDFSNLTGMALNRAAKERLLLDAKIYKEAHQLGIQLGHFVQKNEEGYKELACHRYNQIEMTFEAKNMAVSGHRPEMKITASCEVGADNNRIKTIWIPTAKLMSSPPSNLSQEFFKNGRLVKLQFEHVFSQIPYDWSLSKLKLFNERSEREMTIQKNEMTGILRVPLSLSFLEPQQ